MLVTEIHRISYGAEKSTRHSWCFIRVLATKIQPNCRFTKTYYLPHGAESYLKD